MLLPCQLPGKIFIYSDSDVDAAHAVSMMNDCLNLMHTNRFQASYCFHQLNDCKIADILLHLLAC